MGVVFFSLFADCAKRMATLTLDQFGFVKKRSRPDPEKSQIKHDDLKIVDSSKKTDRTGG